MNLVQHRTVRQFVKFSIVGVTSTAIDWGIHRLLYYGFRSGFRDSTHAFVVDLFPLLQHPDFDGAYTVLTA